MNEKDESEEVKHLNRNIQIYIENFRSEDRDKRYQAFLEIQALTIEKVDWAYEIGKS